MVQTIHSVGRPYSCQIGNCPGNPIWLLGYGTVAASVNKANFVDFALVTFVCCDVDVWVMSHWPTVYCCTIIRTDLAGENLLSIKMVN